MEPSWPCTYGRRGLAMPGKLFVLYLPEGGDVAILSRDVPRAYRVRDPLVPRLREPRCSGQPLGARAADRSPAVA